MDSLPPWRPLLQAALQREGRFSNSRWLQLATVASDGTPRVRTLVFRGCQLQQFWIYSLMVAVRKPASFTIDSMLSAIAFKSERDSVSL